MTPIKRGTARRLGLRRPLLPLGPWERYILQHMVDEAVRARGQQRLSPFVRIAGTS
jgi:hypothetical protein